MEHWMLAATGNRPSRYRSPAFRGGIRDDYLTAYMNCELYEVDCRAPESRGHLGVCVQLVGCVKPDGWQYGPSKTQPGDIAVVEYVSGVEGCYRQEPFYMEQRWLRRVTL